MIHGYNSGGARIIRAAMMQHPSITFFLTGSRYFGEATSNSDWDFFTHHNNTDLKPWLKETGFTKIHTTSYADEMCEEVWRFREKSQDDSGPWQIDIQLVRDAWIKSQAQEAIYSNKLLLELYLEMGKKWKGRRDILWNLCFCAVTGRKYSGELNKHRILGSDEVMAGEGWVIPNVQKILGNF